MFKVLLISLFLLSSILPAFADDEDLEAVPSFASTVNTDERVPLDLGEFQFVAEGSSVAVEPAWVEGSLQWVRMKNNLLLPRAAVKFTIHAEPARVVLSYRDHALTVQGSGQVSTFETFVSLFLPGVFQIQIDGKLAGKIVLKTRTRKNIAAGSRHLIDYSCASWGVEVKGLDSEYLTMGCQMQRVRDWGEEEPLLEIRWAGASTKLADGRTGPFESKLSDGKTMYATLTGADGEKHLVEIKAMIPPRLKRLKFAGGVGYPNKFISQKSPGEKKSEIAPALMLYGNFWINEELSLRGFDAATSKDPTRHSFFNNFGVYFAYDLARPLDKRVQLVALLGFQGLTFAYDGLKGTTFSQAIYPQGFELTYLHAFGMKNYMLGGGMFVQPSSSNPYQNFWVRFGKRWFAEMNYISWQSGDMSAAMWGFSLGFPIGQAY